MLPYALSELIDNALMATKSNQASRQVVITLALSGGSSPQSGLIAVWDNGETRQHSFCCLAPSSPGPFSQVIQWMVKSLTGQGGQADRSKTVCCWCAACDVADTSNVCCNLRTLPQGSFLSLCCSLLITWVSLQGVGWERRS